MDLLVRKRVPFAEGNIMKYVFRWDKKDGVKDLYKARDYLNALIASAELSVTDNLKFKVTVNTTPLKPLDMSKQYVGGEPGSIVYDPYYDGYPDNSKDLADGVK